MSDQTKTAAGFDEQGYLETVFRTFHDAQLFRDKILPLTISQEALALPALLKVFDSTEPAAKRRVADLFVQSFPQQACGIFRPVLRQGNVDRYYWASVILAEIRDMQAVDDLINGLMSSEKSVILGSIKALSILSGQKACDALVAFFLRNQEWIYLSSWIRSASTLSDLIVPALLKAFPGKSKERQSWILKYFAETGAQQAKDLFASILASDPLDLGIFCIAGLGKIGGPESVSVLSKALGNAEWFLRKRVVEALGNCSCGEAVKPLLTVIDDPIVQVRLSAVESLSRVARHALPEVLKELSSSAGQKKINLIRAVGQIHDRRAFEALSEHLSDRSVLFFLLNLLGDMNEPEAVGRLIPFLTDEDWFNRLNALEAIGKLSPPNLADLAHACVDDSNDMVRNAAGRILSRLSD